MTFPHIWFNAKQHDLLECLQESLHMANKKKSSNRTGNELVTVFHAVQQF